MTSNSETQDAERYRALKKRHGYGMVTKLLGADGYNSAKSDAQIDAFSDAAIAELAAYASLDERQRALHMEALLKRAQFKSDVAGDTMP